MFLSMVRDIINRLVAIYTHLTTHLASARAEKIDNLDAAISTRAAAANPLLSVPMLNGLVGNAAVTLAAYLYNIASGHTWASSTSTSFVDAVNITGAGVLEVAILQNSSGTGVVASMDVLIDGVVVASVSTSGATYSTCAVVGSASSSGISPGAVPFSTSLQIRHKMASASAQGTLVYYKYRRSA